ncbi:MAG: META domain-containing protein [Paludibacteraceae bacterium]
MIKRIYFGAFLSTLLMGLMMGSCCSKGGSCSTSSDTVSTDTSLILISSECTKMCGENALQGDFQWNVVAIAGSEVSPKGDGAFMVFDTVSNKMNGNTGCNIINANYVIDSVNANGISILPGQVTMMACPDMNIEQAFLNVLPTINSFSFQNLDSTCCAGQTTLVFLNKEDKEVLKLKKADKKKESK